MRTRIIKYGRYLLIAVLGLILFLFLWVQTGIGLPSLVSRIVSNTGQLGETELHIGSLRGNLFRSLTAKDIALTHPSNPDLLNIDQLHVEFSLFKVLGGSVHLKKAIIDSIALQIKQDQEGSWDIATLGSQEDKENEEKRESSTDIQIDEFRVTSLDITADAYNPNSDSVYNIKQVSIGLDDMVFDESIELNLHTFTGEIWLPDRTDSVFVNVQASLANNVLGLKELRLASAESNVFGSGRINLQWPDSLMHDTNLALRANPLAFDDIRIFAPGLAPGQIADFILIVEGDGQTLNLTNALDVSDGTVIRTEGTISQLPEPNEYELALESEFKELNPQTFGESNFPEGNINLLLTTNLSGSALDNITGFSQINMTGSRIAASEIDTTLLTVQWTDGAADFSFDSGIKDVALSLSGFMFPFASPISYNVRGSVQHIDVAQFTDSSFTSNLNLDVRIAGEDFSPEAANIDASIDFNPSRVNDISISSGSLHAKLQNNRVQADLGLSTSEGDVSTQALVNLEQVLEIETLQAELSRFNLNALLDNPAPSSITGTITGDARLSDPTDANWVIQLGQTSYGDYHIESSSIEGSLEKGLLTVATETAIHSGIVNLNAELRPFDEQISYEITEGTLSNLSLGPIIQNDSLLTDLNGLFTLKGEGVDVASMNAAGQLKLSGSMVNSQPITDADFSFSLADNILQSSLDLLMPASEVRLEVTVDSVSSDPMIKLEQGDFSNLNIGSFLGDTTLNSSLNGTVYLVASGNSTNTLTLDSEINLLPSTLNNATFKESQASILFREGRGHMDASFFIDEGSVVIQADTLVLGEAPEYAITAEINNLNLGNLINQDSLSSIVNMSIQGRGSGSNQQDIIASGLFRSTNSSFGDAELEQADVMFSLEEGLLTIDQLSLTSNVFTLAGSGDVALFDDMESIASDFSATGTITNLDVLAPLIGAEALGLSSGEFELGLSGPPGVLQFDSELEILGFIYNDYRMGVIDARVAGNLDEKRRPSSVTLSGTADQFSIPGFAMDEVIYSATYADSTVRFSLDNQIDSDRNAQINGLLSLFADSQYVALNTVNLKLDEDQWALQQPTQITLGIPIIVDDFHLTTEELSTASTQFVRFNGILDVEGTQDIALQVNELQIGTLASLFGFPGLDGKLNLDASLQGEASSPKLEGTVDLSVVSFNRQVGDLSAKVNYDSLRLNLDAKMEHRQGDSLTMKGYLPVDLRLAPPLESTTGTGISQNLERGGDVNIDIQSDSLIIGWLLPFIDQNLVNRLDGALATDIKIRGTGEDPQLSGEGRFINGVIHSPLIGVTFRDINSKLSLQDNIIRFANTSTRTGTGTFDVEGELRLQDLANAEINIDMRANEFNVINTREYRSTLSGDLNFAGTLTEPVLTGDVQLLNTDVFFENASNQELANLNVQLTDEDLRMLENQFGVRPTARDTATSDVYEALTMDIEIELGRDTWIRSRSNPEMNVQFDGVLDLTKRPYGEQEIVGSIEVNPDRSYITQFGKRFEITQGTITFNGSATDPILNFEARYEVPSRLGQENAVTVFMDIEGTLETLELTLRSDPTMELTDMVSYVVTGQPASEALQLGGLGSQSAESIALSSGVGLLSNAIESLVQESGLELDVIQIEPLDNARGATITAGKYVTPRIFTAVSQPIGAANADGSTSEQGTIVTIELELIDSLLLRLLGGESLLEINFLWHYAY
ncbi:MAG: translocation/assembly module TamB [Rhodothermaceae bacterium]|nr:translocation/assembly module TamB [Rhodothermaceae bacterium]